MLDEEEDADVERRMEAVKILEAMDVSNRDGGNTNANATATATATHVAALEAGRAEEPPSAEGTGSVDSNDAATLLAYHLGMYQLIASCCSFGGDETQVLCTQLVDLGALINGLMDPTLEFYVLGTLLHYLRTVYLQRPQGRELLGRHVPELWNVVARFVAPKNGLVAQVLASVRKARADEDRRARALSEGSAARAQAVKLARRRWAKVSGMPLSTHDASDGVVEGDSKLEPVAEASMGAGVPPSPAGSSYALPVVAAAGYALQLSTWTADQSVLAVWKAEVVLEQVMPTVALIMQHCWTDRGDDSRHQGLLVKVLDASRQLLQSVEGGYIRCPTKHVLLYSTELRRCATAAAGLLGQQPRSEAPPAAARGSERSDGNGGPAPGQYASNTLSFVEAVKIAGARAGMTLTSINHEARTTRLKRHLFSTARRAIAASASRRLALAAGSGGDDGGEAGQVGGRCGSWRRCRCCPVYFRRCCRRSGANSDDAGTDIEAGHSASSRPRVLNVTSPRLVRPGMRHYLDRSSGEPPRSTRRRRLDKWQLTPLKTAMWNPLQMQGVLLLHALRDVEKADVMAATGAAATELDGTELPALEYARTPPGKTLVVDYRDIDSLLQVAATATSEAQRVLQSGRPAQREQLAVMNRCVKVNAVHSWGLRLRG